MVPFLLGIDPRWVHIGVVLGITCLFGAFLLRSLGTASPSRQAVFVSAFAGLFLFLFSTEFIFFSGIAHTPPLWLWMSLLAFAVLEKRSILSAFFLGVVLASRQTSILFLPLMAIYWLRMSNRLRTTIGLCAIAVVVWLLVCGPFLLLDPWRFVVTPLQFYTKVGEWDFSRGSGSYAADTIGLTYMVRSLGVEGIFPVSAALVSIMPLLLAWRHLRTETDALLFIGLTGVASTLMAPVPFHYEYFPSLIMISFGALAAASEEDTLWRVEERGSTA